MQVENVPKPGVRWRFPASKVAVISSTKTLTRRSDLRMIGAFVIAVATFVSLRHNAQYSGFREFSK